VAAVQIKDAVLLVVAVTVRLVGAVGGCVSEEVVPLASLDAAAPAFAFTARTTK